MTKKVTMTPSGSVTWLEQKLADGIATVSPEFDDSLLSMDLESLVNLSHSAFFNELPDYELIGEGNYFHGKVYKVGELAVKFARGRGVQHKGFATHDPSDIRNSSRIAVSLNRGLSKIQQKSPAVAAPKHYACWQHSGDMPQYQVQVMDIVPGSSLEPSQLPYLMHRKVKKAGSRALKEVGIPAKEVFWQDLPANIMTTPDGTPYIIDLMPVKGLPSFRGR